MLSRNYRNLVALWLVVSSLLLSGCLKISQDKKTPALLATINADKKQLQDEVDRFASVTSMRAKMYLNFEDNSFAQFGSTEVYRAADGEIVVQRPASILMKVKVPFVGTDVAQMTSDGVKFRVAILQDGGTGKYRKFVVGTNDADYSKLSQNIDLAAGTPDAVAAKQVSAFSNLRPQHFTDAMLVRPIDKSLLYTHSTIYQVEEDETEDKKSPSRKVTRGYYLLDEFMPSADGSMTISRRFWFDRVGLKIRLAKQQIFDSKGEISSDIVYGREGSLTSTGEFSMPLQVSVTRPQEKYSMRLRYQTPEKVVIGEAFKPDAFVLPNTWDLEELDLDKKLADMLAAQPPGQGKAPGTKIQLF